jgi:branched-chain amino acid transport system substrate-binding protein
VGQRREQPRRAAGAPVKLVVLNDNSDPNTAARNYKTLITQDHVDLTLGPFSSLLTLPSARVAHKYGYAMVEGSGTAPTVYAASLKNLFGVSAPVANQLVPFADWVAELPLGSRPRTAAYAMVADQFADPPVKTAQASLEKAGVTTVYSNASAPYTDTSPAALAADARQVAAQNPQIVVIGSVDVPTVSAFINEFKKLRFNPRMLIATSGPDQGQAFLKAISPPSNANGIMVPDGWYGGFSDALSHVMVQEYIARYGGTTSDINADVAEAYSAGQVMADAVQSVRPQPGQDHRLPAQRRRDRHRPGTSLVGPVRRQAAERPEHQGRQLRLPVAAGRQLRAGTVQRGSAFHEHHPPESGVDEQLT